MNRTHERASHHDHGTARPGKTVRNIYSMSAEDHKLLQKVKQMLGAYSDSEAIRRCIHEIHERLVATAEKKRR
jgi:hypothetical protein